MDPNAALLDIAMAPLTDRDKGVILRCLFRAALAYREDALEGEPEFSERREALADEAKSLAIKLKGEGWSFD